jgi:hypothetical protein
MSLYTTECRLAVSGLDDLILPISTVSVRMRHQIASYMSWTLPDPLPWADQIIDRMNGNMLLYCSLDGGELVQVLRTFLRNIYFTQDSKNMVLTLAGDRQISFASVSAQATIEKIIRKKRNDDDTYTLEISPDYTLTPYYEVDDGNSFFMQVDRVFFNIGKDGATMNISGSRFDPPVPPTPTGDLYRWMMDEGEGVFVEEVSNDKHGQINEGSLYTVWGLVGEGDPPQEHCIEITASGNHTLEGVMTGLTPEADDVILPITIEAWIRIDDNFAANHSLQVLAFTADLEGWGSVFEDRQVNLHLSSARRLSFGAYSPVDYLGYAEATAATSHPVPIGQWTHVAATASSQEVKLYLNGEEIPTSWSHVEDPNIIIVAQNPRPWRIGADPSSRFNWFHGMLADVRIWKEVRTEQQIYDNMLAGRTSL